MIVGFDLDFGDAALRGGEGKGGNALAEFGHDFVDGACERSFQGASGGVAMAAAAKAHGNLGNVDLALAAQT
jgi:hypothetical protein